MCKAENDPEKFRDDDSGNRCQSGYCRHDQDSDHMVWRENGHCSECLLDGLVRIIDEIYHDYAPSRSGGVDIISFCKDEPWSESRERNNKKAAMKFLNAVLFERKESVEALIDLANKMKWEIVE